VRTRQNLIPGRHWWLNWSRLGHLVFLLSLFALGEAGCRQQVTVLPTPAFITEQPNPLASTPPLAAYENLQFDHLGIEEGLSQSTVSTIMQDSQGFLWVGTFDGLNRFDGNQFVTYRYHADDPNSIGGNLIFSLREARDGRIWVATQGDGISWYDPDTDRFTNYRHEENNPSSLSADYVQAVLEDRAGNIWFGTVQGLDRFDPVTGQFDHYRNEFSAPESAFDSNLIEALVEDVSGQIWLGTRNGLLTFDPVSQTFVHHELDPTNVAAQTIGSLFLDDQARLWVSTLAGLYLVNPLT
jgi:ligand-binding sensor domain-containing protein